MMSNGWNVRLLRFEWKGMGISREHTERDNDNVQSSVHSRAGLLEAVGAVCQSLLTDAHNFTKPKLGPVNTFR